MENDEKFFEVHYDQLLPFLAEHTGLSQADAKKFLEAQRLYWEMHPDGLTYALGDEND